MVGASNTGFNRQREQDGDDKSAVQNGPKTTTSKTAVDEKRSPAHQVSPFSHINMSCLDDVFHCVLGLLYHNASTHKTIEHQPTNQATETNIVHYCILNNTNNTKQRPSDD